MTAQPQQRLSFLEKSGYSLGDSAANFVFMTMVLFQLNFYTDVFGLTATAAAAILLWPRLWDAVADPIVGILADRTSTRWGKFRPWILFTTIPWVIVMVLAYTTPTGFSPAALIAYAVVTNTLMMTIYSTNNMPYAALGGVMTGDMVERTKLNSFRFFAVNAAQFIVGGFTLPLVAKFASQHAIAAQHTADAVVTVADKQHGWSVTMSIWAAVCLVCFLVTFFTTKERIQPVNTEKSSPLQDMKDLLKNNPWKVMWFWTLVHFAILTFRGGALYNYYHHYADKTAMFECVKAFGLTAPALQPGAPAPAGMLEWLGYIVHGDQTASNVADVFNSIINMFGTALIMVVILLSPSLAKQFGKKAVAAVGFVLATIGSLAYSFLAPTNAWGMVAVTAFVSIVYAPTIPLTWSIFADVADFSEWKVGRRFTGMVFATIGFALKSGLALGSACFLWLMVGMYHYDTQGTPEFYVGSGNYPASFSSIPSMTSKLQKAADPVSVYVKEHLSADTVKGLANVQETNTAAIEALLVKDFNKLIAGDSIFDAKRFDGIKLRTGTEELLAKIKEKHTDYETMSLNRALLEDAFANEISRGHNQPEESRQGFRAFSGIAVAVLFGICSILLFLYPLNKQVTIQMADELAARRAKLTQTPKTA